MASKKSIAVRLSPGKPKKGGVSAPPKSDDFIGNLIHHPDIGEGMAIAGDYAGVVFETQHGEEIARLEQEIIELNVRYGVSSDTLASLEKKKHGTPSSKKSAPERSGTDKIQVKLSDWRGRDLIGASLALLMCFAAMGLGWSNVYANLLSGNPTFIERPWLAASLAMILPIGSTGLKFVTNFITVDDWRRRYCLFIYLLLITLLIAWGVLFGLTYDGVAGGFDWSALGETNVSAKALVYIQLLCEMVGATALYLAFEEISARYSPDSWIHNSEYYVINCEYEAHLKAHEKLRDHRGAVHGRLATLRALREQKINEAVAHYLALRATSHPKFGE